VCSDYTEFALVADVAATGAGLGAHTVRALAQVAEACGAYHTASATRRGSRSPMAEPASLSCAAQSLQSTKWERYGHSGTELARIQSHFLGFPSQSGRTEQLRYSDLSMSYLMLLEGIELSTSPLPRGNLVLDPVCTRLMAPQKRLQALVFILPECDWGCWYLPGPAT